MNCSEFQDRLTEWMDQPLADRNPSSDGASHLAECHSCREAWEELQVLGEAVRVWRSAVPQVNFRERVLVELRQGLVESTELTGLPVSQKSAPVSHRSNWRRVAVAALFLVGLGVGFALLPGRPASDPISDRNFAVKSTLSKPGGSDIIAGALGTLDPARSPAVNISAPLSATALIRETATALSGVADALIPINRAIVSAPPKKRDDLRGKGSEIVRRDEEAVPLSQELGETLYDLWLPPETADFPST